MRGSVTEPAHRTFVGTPGTAGAVAFVRTSATAWTGRPARRRAVRRDAADRREHVTLFPTIGIRTVLRTGVYTTLRLDDPQANQTLRCDPNFAQGQEFSAFRYGCEPWYGENHFNGDVPVGNTASWWNTSTQLPTASGSPYGDQGAGFGVNSSNNPWRCVLTAPGLSTGQIGDGIAVATDNCDNIHNNSCQRFDCNYDGDYDGKRRSANRRRRRRPPADPRGSARRTRASSTCSSSRTRRARA